MGNNAVELEHSSGSVDMENRGRQDDIDKYRSIAPVSTFRKVSERTIMAQFQEYGGGFYAA